MVVRLNESYHKFAWTEVTVRWLKFMEASILFNKPFAPAQIVTAVSQVLNAMPSPPRTGAPYAGEPKQQPDEQ